MLNYSLLREAEEKATCLRLSLQLALEEKTEGLSTVLANHPAKHKDMLS